MAMALPGRWALAGLAAEPERVRVRPSGSAQTEGIKFVFFPKYFSVQKQFQEMPRKCLEARKIPRKSQKF
jgi:hypothetical protein